jgi:DNA-directed RNA polymerase subunit omega
MNVTYLERAKERVNNTPLLINMVSRRVRQLNQGKRPLVKPDDLRMPNVDIALKEIAEGKLASETTFTTPVRPTEADNLIQL